MSNLTAFQFDNSQVRTILIDDQPWFVGKDVCDILEMGNPRQVLSRLKDYEKGVQNVDTIGGSQSMTVISESGLYRLVLTSRKPQAEPFQDWVCQEVIPQIRKTGSYSVNQQPELPPNKKAVQVAHDVRDILDTLDDQPRLSQFLVDQALNAFPAAKNQLNGTPLRGVAEIAEEMGFPVSVNNRSQLGKFVKSQVGEMAEEEKRLCNGTMRLIKCYPDCEEVRSAIALFFDR